MIRAVGAALLIVATASGVAQADEPYPTRPISMVVAFPPGGLADNTARPVAANVGAATVDPEQKRRLGWAEPLKSQFDPLALDPAGAGLDRRRVSAGNGDLPAG